MTREHDGGCLCPVIDPKDITNGVHVLCHGIIEKSRLEERLASLVKSEEKKTRKATARKKK